MNNKRKSIKKIIFTSFGMALLVFSLCLAGCGPRDPQGGKYCIGAMLRVKPNRYIYEIESGMRKAAAARGVALRLLQSDRFDDKQGEALYKELLDSNLDALIILPESQEKALEHCIPLILEANRLKKPVIFIHSAIEKSVMGKTPAHVDCTITSDNEKGGRLAAEYLAKKLGGKGKILMVQGDLEGYVTQRRRNGFLQELKKHPDMKTIDSSIADWELEKALVECRQTFKADKEIMAVYAHSEPMGLGASDAAVLAKYRVLPIVAFDGTDEGMDSIRNKRLSALITQSPDEMGRCAIETTIKLIRGGKVREDIFTTTEIISEETISLPFH